MAPWVPLRTKLKNAKTMSNSNQPTKPLIDIDDDGPVTGVAVKSKVKTKKPKSILKTADLKNCSCALQNLRL